MTIRTDRSIIPRFHGIKSNISKGENLFSKGEIPAFTPSYCTGAEENSYPKQNHCIPLQYDPEKICLKETPKMDEGRERMRRQ